MAKKKNKTIASTRKKPETAEQKQKKEDKKKKGIKKIITKYKKVKKDLIKPKKEKQVIQPKEQPPKEEKTQDIPAETIRPVKESAQPRQPRFTSQQKRKMTGIALMAIGTFTLIFVGYFLFGKFFRPQAIAELMPLEGTVAIFEVNIDPADGQSKKFYELMNKYPVYQSQNIKAALETLMPINYVTDIEPWVGRKAGFALIDNHTLLFLESRNHDMTVKTLESFALKQAGDQLQKQERGSHQVYTFSATKPGAFTFVGNYLVYSGDEIVLLGYIDRLSGKKVSEGDNYIKVRNNLPQGGLLFGYADYRQLWNLLTKDPSFVAQKGQDLLALKPFLDVFQSAGMTAFAEKNRFVAQTFTTIDTAALGDQSYITFSEKYNGELLALANPEPIFVAAGHDLTKELSRLEDIFKSGTKTPALVFDGILEAQKETYFGSELDLREDLYPLFTGEYLLTVEGSLEEPVTSLFIKMDNKDSQLPKLEKAVAKFTEVSGIFTPRVQEVTLPDGTVGKEIVASPEKIETMEKSYESHKYTALKIGETGYNIYYLVNNDIAVFSSSDQVIHSILDRIDGRTNDGYSKTPYYEKNIREVLRSSDEMMQVKLGAITEFFKLNEDKTLAAYLVPFTNFTIAKNFFTDGISTIYLMEVI